MTEDDIKQIAENADKLIDIISSIKMQNKKPEVSHEDFWVKEADEKEEEHTRDDQVENDRDES